MTTVGGDCSCRRPRSGRRARPIAADSRSWARPMPATAPCPPQRTPPRTQAQPSSPPGSRSASRASRWAVPRRSWPSCSTTRPRTSRCGCTPHRRGSGRREDPLVRHRCRRPRDGAGRPESSRSVRARLGVSRLPSRCGPHVDVPRGPGRRCRCEACRRAPRRLAPPQQRSFSQAGAPHDATRGAPSTRSYRTGSPRSSSRARGGVRTHTALGYAADRFLVIPNGVDTDRFVPSPEARAAVREEFAVRAGGSGHRPDRPRRPAEEPPGLLRGGPAVLRAGGDARVPSCRTRASRPTTGSYRDGARRRAVPTASRLGDHATTCPHHGRARRRDFSSLGRRSRSCSSRRCRAARRARPPTSATAR